MKIYAFICSRDKNFKPTTLKLLKYLDRLQVNTKLIIGKPSIFNAYNDTFLNLKADPDDIVMFLHDDIEIISSRLSFLEAIGKLNLPDTGFIGVAGTTLLSENCVWWDLELRKQKFHRGIVLQGETLNTSYGNFFGPFGQVAVLDGCFLAAKVSTLNKINLNKPDEFPGQWDFYDLYYTIQSHLLGLKNYVVPIITLHNSAGELAGRDSWHKNREAFISLYFNDKNSIQV